MLHLNLYKIATAAVFAFAAASALADSDAGDSNKEHIELLRRHKIGSDDGAILKYLEGLLPSADVQANVDKLVRQLDSDKFSQREEASAKLSTLGPAARAKVLEAAKSENEETAWRAKRILQQLDSGDNLRQREVLAYAAVKVLRSTKPKEAVPVLLSLIAQMDEANLRDAAAEALWASSHKSHIKLLEAGLNEPKVNVQAAAIVALEVARGAGAVDSIQKFLKSDDETIRLAAARALINHQPLEVAGTLVGLVASKDEEVSALAEALLREQTGVTVEPRSDQTHGDAWRAWADENLLTAKLKKLGEERLNLSHGRGLLVELFTRNSADVTKGYGRLVYQATVPGKTSVSDGVLRVEYGGAEGDQRMAVTSQKLTGRREWPKRLEVRATMGGEADGSGAYHVGISVGQIKVLYHPAYTGGGFRIEDVDSHTYIVSNEDMGFTPTAGAAQEMTIRVERTAAGAQLDVEVTQGDRTFKKSVLITAAQLGKYDRIGLERSGRSGGAALFDSVSVKLGR